MIFPMALLRANDALLTPNRKIEKVSSISAVVSPFTLTVSVFVVSPGLKVTVGQQTNWKSEKEAVLVEVCQPNEMGTTAADERVTVKFIGVVPLFPSTTCASAMLIWGGGSSSKMEMVVLEGVPSVAPP